MSKEIKQSFEELLAKFFDYLKLRARGEKTLKTYRWRLGKLKTYLDLQNIQFYNESVGQSYLESVLGSFDYVSLSGSQKQFVNVIRIFTEFQKTGDIRFGTHRQSAIDFFGQIGKTITDFITHRKELFGLSDSTIKMYTLGLSFLFNFFNNLNIKNVDEISKKAIIEFISSLDPKKQPLNGVTLRLIKNYLKYLYDNKHLPMPLSELIPKVSSTFRSKLPSTFSTEEIKTLLASVDRGSPKGKRDYAILLLAIKLGLRSSDIRSLKFEYLHWQKNTLEFQQHKTGKTIVLPLLPEVGNAIIDYLQNGRPVSDENYMFLQLISPYKPLYRTSIGDMVYSQLKRAGISCFNRKHGPHALRHSFAGMMLNNKTPLPIISEALGHSSIEPTMNYLRIDIGMLRQCALEVPMIPSEFYINGRGGLYHG